MNCGFLLILCNAQLNAFCTQVTGIFEFTSQATKEDIISKLLKRLRNLLYVICVLNPLTTYAKFVNQLSDVVNHLFLKF